ncbi:MAG: hypothetical protein A4E45_01562 [Methanosaeta sp. PtaB.Bin039]|nr:MAG: hypothetical protein A4E45_01562 [Methanosaeta sp. PtaB.Bin039]
MIWYMNTISRNDSKLIKLLSIELGISEGAAIRPESTFADYPIRFDLVIQDGIKTYIVDIRRIVQLEALSHLGLLKLLLSDKLSGASNIELVIAGIRITSEAAQAAKNIGIRFVKLPSRLSLEEPHGKTGAAPVKLTSPKSWQVISCLLKMKAGTSIRRLSIESGVSYGWTYATVRALVSKGIASDDGGNLKITDINKLLNGVAWERPFERNFTKEIRIAAYDAIGLAREISAVCDELQIPCAFTGFSAGEIYTGYSARHDTVYVYLEKKDHAELAGMFDLQNDGGIAVRIYSPDRDVFKDRMVFSIDGVWLVSPSQALLDCAGMGYAGRDLTQKLVETYGRL